MNPSSSGTSPAGNPFHARVIVLLLISFVVGLAVGNIWNLRKASGLGGTGNESKAVHKLSDSSKSMLQGLNSNVEIRFYSLLDPTGTPEPLQAFAGRVDQLLSQYKEAAGNNLSLKRFTRQQTDAGAAMADGINAFHLNTGEACFLGMAIAGHGRKETLGRLQPQWEAALESDLTRAIQRLTAVNPPGSSSRDEPPISANVLKEVTQFFANLDEVSLEEGTRMLRGAGMTEFQTAMNEAQAQIHEANQRLVQANKSQTEIERQAALKQLQQVQAAQTEKLSRIASQTEARIRAFEQLKKQ